MNYRKMLSPKHLAADDFVDRYFNPIKTKFVIERVFMAKPPAGGPEKMCFKFAGEPRTAFLPNGQVKMFARSMRLADPSDWVGIEMEITSGPTTFAGKDTTGMIIVSAKLPQGKGPSKPEVTPDKPTMWKNAKEAYLRDGDLDAVLEKATMSEENIARLVAECRA